MFAFGKYEKESKQGEAKKHGYAQVLDHCPLEHVEEFTPHIRWGRYWMQDKRTVDIAECSIVDADLIMLVGDFLRIRNGHTNRSA